MRFIFVLGSQGFGGAHESIMLGQASPVAHLDCNRIELNDMVFLFKTRLTAVVEKIVNYKITLTFDVIDTKYEMQRQLPKQRCTLKMQ